MAENQNENNNAPTDKNPDASQANAENVTEIEARYQDLALRLATFPADPRLKDPQLLLGKLPEKLPFEVPIPEDSRVVGTLIRSPLHMEITLDSALEAGQLIAFYSERMEAAGWEKLDPMPGHRQGGFTHSGFSGSQGVQFCHSSRGPNLSVQTYVRNPPLTEVRLTLNLDPQNSPCAMRKRQQQMGMPFGGIIPNLNPPAGTQQLGGGGGGGGGNSWYSTANLESELALGILTDHYTGQLAKAGWAKQTEGQSGPLAWNSWQFKDEEGEEWRGLFFILKVPESQRQHFLYVRAELDGGGQPPQFSNWISSAPLG